MLEKIKKIIHNNVFDIYSNVNRRTEYLIEANRLNMLTCTSEVSQSYNSLGNELEGEIIVSLIYLLHYVYNKDVVSK